ncbi:MAG: hypothetical protein NC041_03425 [Bacteroides sp.]|nr:hypothetical protein [Prevotella sp.]MCM1408175.1 helicase [Treponema brennaborense]MCM1469499.1 hypothetical protein [Bacteroides sp.]
MQKYSANSAGYAAASASDSDSEKTAEKKICRLDPDNVCRYLSSGGRFAAMSGKFEERPSQLALMKDICGVFNDNGIGVFEAGTGVGKSFAYLIPAMLWAAENKERVVVSTGTINLQQQLMDKDIPAAKNITGKNISAVLVKGRQNYVCLRRFSDMRSEPDLFDEETEEIAHIAEWVKKTSDGSRSDLPFVPSANIWQRINSEADACKGMRCPFKEDCFVMRVRKEAVAANIIVVNHHILFADIESRLQGAGYDDAALLPPYRRLIFDEAHGMESAATSFFSESVTRFSFLKQLNLLYRQRRGAAAGYLFTLEALSSGGDVLSEIPPIIERIKTDIQRLEDASSTLTEHDSSWRLCGQSQKDAAAVLGAMNELHASALVFCAKIRNIIDGIAEEDRETPSVWETKQILRRIEAAAQVCGNFTAWEEHPDMVFWIEKRRLIAESEDKKSTAAWYPRFVQTPLDISFRMNEGIFEPISTIVCTSATIKTGGNFSFWMKRSGVVFTERSRVCEREYPSSFLYEKNALLLVPSDAPMPDQPSFQEFLEKASSSLIAAAGGRTLVLFTSYESLRRTCRSARTALSELGIPVLMQGEDDRSRLLARFAEDTASVLFATDSFWEGVDVPGESLSQVIIAKLPFSVPSDPVFAARAESIEKRGGSAFMELSVPEAVIKFRQGFGRLIRHSEDRGVVCVLDRRIIEKRYGRIFLSSLPETKRKIAPLDECAEAAERFLR